jgi:hypothetical protein
LLRFCCVFVAFLCFCCFCGFFAFLRFCHLKGVFTQNTISVLHGVIRQQADQIRVNPDCVGRCRTTRCDTKIVFCVNRPQVGRAQLAAINRTL